MPRYEEALAVVRGVLAVATAGAEVVGVAGMGADTAQLWQIGIDVREEFRGRGIGATLTARLAGEALVAACIPSYGVALSNLASLRTALGAGFRPGWVEAYTISLGT